MQSLIRSASMLAVVATMLTFWGYAQAETPNAAGTPGPDTTLTAAQLETYVTNARNPARSSSRKVRIEIHPPDGGPSVTWYGTQVRKTVDDKRRVLTVLTAPATQAGFAFLVSETSSQRHTRWIYVPPVRRVRRMIHEGEHEYILGTDLSAGDLGFLRFEPRAVAKGQTTVPQEQDKAWKLEETPADPTGYSRILTWVSTDNHLPLRREYYDEAGALWKVDTREVEDVQGVPTVTKLVSKDVQDGGDTVLSFSDIRYDVDLADDLFRPESLPVAVEKISSATNG